MLVTRRATIAVILINVILASMFGILVVLKSTTYSSSIPSLQSATAEPKPVEQAAATVPGLPLRLKIPKIRVDTAIESLGLTKEGDLAAPAEPDNTGWYNGGPRPGWVGSAVIDGHFGYANNTPAVFDNLHTLKASDEIFVEDDKKITYKFVVTELKSYGANDDATAVFRSNDGRAHLNLITCQGVWSKNSASYSNRLVVFADLVKE